MTPPGEYKHFKGEWYRVLFLARCAAEEGYGNWFVVYVPLYGGGEICVRTEDSFNEEVVDSHGVKVPRFRFVCS